MLPTYEQCNEIVKRNPSFVRKEEWIAGTHIVQFNYFLASYQDFAKEYFPGVDAFELRGLTFIERDWGWERQLMLHKFYRLNQSVGYLYPDVKDKKIVRVQEKMDGSLIRFVRLNDGTVIAKTKFSFDGEQAVAANKIYAENKNVRDFVNLCLKHGIAALFEYTSPYNRIVLPYAKSELVLLQMREEVPCTGRYVEDLRSLTDGANIEIAYEQQPHKTLDEYVEWALTATDTEGVVITFDDGQMLKIKTAWYDSLHYVLTEQSKRENDLVEVVLADSVDDLIAQIPIEQVEVREKIEKIAKLVTDFINKEAERCYYLVDCEYRGNRKHFAMANNHDKLFGIIMKLVEANSRERAIELLKEYVAKSCRTLDAARQFLDMLERNVRKGK